MVSEAVETAWAAAVRERVEAAMGMAGTGEPPQAQSGAEDARAAAARERVVEVKVGVEVATAWVVAAMGAVVRERAVVVTAAVGVARGTVAVVRVKVATEELQAEKELVVEAVKQNWQAPY